MTRTMNQSSAQATGSAEQLAVTVYDPQRLFAENISVLADFYFGKRSQIALAARGSGNDNNNNNSNEQDAGARGARGGRAVQTQFSELQRFIRQYRNANVTHVTPELTVWLTQIAPSCVYPVRIHGEGVYYQCCLCPTPVKAQQSIVRHYREQHYDLMPPAIFGEQKEYMCRLCNIYIGKRYEHLQMHYHSLCHLEKLAERGSSKAMSQLQNFNEKKLEAFHCSKLSKKRKFAEEQDQWEAFFREVQPAYNPDSHLRAINLPGQKDCQDDEDNVVDDKGNVDDDDDDDDDDETRLDEDEELDFDDGGKVDDGGDANSGTGADADDDADDEQEEAVVKKKTRRNKRVRVRESSSEASLADHVEDNNERATKKIKRITSSGLPVLPPDQPKTPALAETLDDDVRLVVVGSSSSTSLSDQPSVCAVPVSDCPPEQPAAPAVVNACHDDLNKSRTSRAAYETDETADETDHETDAVKSERLDKVLLLETPECPPKPDGPETCAMVKSLSLSFDLNMKLATEMLNAELDKSRNLPRSASSAGHI